MNLTNFIKSFDGKEIRDILISVLVLGFLFALYEFTYNKLVFSIIIVGLAFVLHEMGHRYVAMAKGLSARFMAWPTGLFFSLLLGILTNGSLIFAAPGAVLISDRVKTSRGYRKVRFTKEDYGRISLAGPMMNVILAFILSFFLNFHPLMRLGVIINLFLALFNLFPFHPLDGAKIIFWDKKKWLITFGLVLASLLIFEVVSPVLFSIILFITIAFILISGMGYKPF